MSAETTKRLIQAGLIVAVLAFAAWGLKGTYDKGHPAEADAVDLYCSYGAVSWSQYDGCMDHVTKRTATGINTNAGRFARGELRSCLGDAGPLCVPR